MLFEYYSDVTDEIEPHIQNNVRKMFAEDLKNFKRKRVRITLEQVRSKRTLPQNALFHMYVGIIARELGYGGRDGLEELKDIIKFKFCQIEKTMEGTGEVVKLIQPTHTMTKSEFIELIDSVIRWAASDLQITLPDSADYDFTDDEKAQ